MRLTPSNVDELLFDDRCRCFPLECSHLLPGRRCRARYRELVDGRSRGDRRGQGVLANLLAVGLNRTLLVTHWTIDRFQQYGQTHPRWKREVPRRQATDPRLPARGSTLRPGQHAHARTRPRPPLGVERLARDQVRPDLARRTSGQRLRTLMPRPTSPSHGRIGLQIDHASGHARSCGACPRSAQVRRRTTLHRHRAATRRSVINVIWQRCSF